MNQQDQDNRDHYISVLCARVLIEQYQQSLDLTNKFIAQWEEFLRGCPDATGRINQVIMAQSSQALSQAEALRRMEEIEATANMDDLRDVLAHHADLDEQAQRAAASQNGFARQVF